MGYTIKIDYIDQCAEDKLAKLTLLDEKGKKVLNKVPVSMPHDIFEKKNIGFYFDVNNVLPSVSNIDFADQKGRDLLEKNSAYLAYYEFGDNERFYDSNNQEYITHKKNILFFPQSNNTRLGVDKTAFILHSSDYYTFIDGIKNAKDITFIINKPTLSLKGTFKDRNIKKETNINKIYNIAKEISLKNQPLTSLNEHLTNKKRKQRQEDEDRKNRIMEIQKEKEMQDELLKNKIKESEIIQSKPAKNNEEKPANLNGSIFLDENNNNPLKEKVFRNGPLRRGFDFMTLLMIYNYFESQNMSFNRELFQEAKKNIPNGDDIKNFSFISNEGGFFMQLYGDNDKQQPLGTLTYDYELSSLILKNESSSISLNPKADNPQLLELNAFYEEGNNIKIEMVNINDNSNNNIDKNLSLGNLFVLDQSQKILDEMIFCSQYNFKNNGSNLLDINYEIKTKEVNESSPLLDLYHIHHIEKLSGNEEIFTNITHLHFENRNPEAFSLNKDYIVNAVNENDFSEFDKNHGYRTAEQMAEEHKLSNPTNHVNNNVIIEENNEQSTNLNDNLLDKVLVEEKNSPVLPNIDFSSLISEGVDNIQQLEKDSIARSIQDQENEKLRILNEEKQQQEAIALQTEEIKSQELEASKKVLTEEEINIKNMLSSSIDSFLSTEKILDTEEKLVIDESVSIKTNESPIEKEEPQLDNSNTLNNIIENFSPENIPLSTLNLEGNSGELFDTPLFDEQQSLPIILEPSVIENHVIDESLLSNSELFDNNLSIDHYGDIISQGLSSDIDYSNQSIYDRQSFEYYDNNNVSFDHEQSNIPINEDVASSSYDNEEEQSRKRNYGM